MHARREIKTRKNNLLYLKARSKSINTQYGNVRCFFSVITLKHSDSELQQAMLWAKFLESIEPAELRAVVSAESGKGLLKFGGVNPLRKVKHG
jgi:hypothetical protein